MNEPLVDRAMHGDPDAFSTLIHERFRELHGLARLISGDEHAGEDALQDALIRAWRDIPQLRDTSHFDAWLRRIVVNACRDQHRQRRRRPTVRMDGVDPQSARNEYLLVDQRDELVRAFVHLTPSQRAVIALRFYLDLPGDEAAASLSLRPSTYRTRLRRALQALAATLAAGQAGDTARSEATSAEADHD